MKFERQLKDEVSVDLTPLIDVVFLLLIFFMVTTTFTRDSNLLINLPEANGAESATDQPLRIEILVARNGSYSVNGRALVNNQSATLMDAIAELSAGDTSTPVTLTADAQTTHQSVVTAMDVLAQLGFTRLNIATRQPDDGD